MAVLSVSSCSTRFPSTSVRISGVLEGGNIEHQLTIHSATEILCIVKTLIDYIIMKWFRAKLDRVAERLSFQDSNVTMPATHARRSFKLQYCSVIKQTGDEQRLPIWVAKKYVTPAAHEALQRVSSTARPQKDTLAAIEPRVTLAAHEALQRVSSTARPQNDTLVLIESRIASAHTLATARRRMKSGKHGSLLEQ